jgi:AAA domain
MPTSSTARLRRKPRAQPRAVSSRKAVDRSRGRWKAQVATASALKKMSFTPLRYVVPGIIAEGATLLVSRPKLGKSWFALDLSIAIATGRTALGTLQPETGDVLYLALEDGERRLQRRMATLLPGDEAWPARLRLATRWRRANEGGLADVADWCRSVRHPAAVVIDTLDRFRSLQSERGNQIYDAIAQLQRIASEHGVAVIIVHHERRRSAGDPVDTIAGPAGLGGVADTILSLRRDDRGALLYVRGRDVEDSESLLVFDRANCRWALDGPVGAGAAAKSDGRAAVVAALSHSIQPLPVREIAAAVGRSRGATDTLLHRMVTDGEVVRVGQGRYKLAPDHPQRPVITFTWQPVQD